LHWCNSIESIANHQQSATLIPIVLARLGIELVEMQIAGLSAVITSAAKQAIATTLTHEK
jgi:hypothetical protein